MKEGENTNNLPGIPEARRCVVPDCTLPAWTDRRCVNHYWPAITQAMIDGWNRQEQKARIAEWQERRLIN